jgi:hypothetical protein
VHGLSEQIASTDGRRPSAGPQHRLPLGNRHHDQVSVHFAPGDAVLLREVFLGRVWAARPVRVVRDTADLVAVYFAPGTLWKRPVDGDEPLRLQQANWTLADVEWRGNAALRHFTPGTRHSVIVFWSEDFAEFRGWYVNLETPMTRTSLGFDYLDQALDIVIEPDRSWRWKDEDEFALAQERGLISEADAAALRAEGLAVVARLDAWEAPFADGWQDWRPQPGWRPVPLPAGWDVI